jgi:hypothetical protein
MDSWRIAEIVLLSVLVGTLLPVLFQLRSTLRTAQKLLEEAGPRLHRSLDEVTTAAGRVDRVGSAVERLAGSVKLAATLGAAVGPAVAAAVKALRGPPGNGASAALETPPLKEKTHGE